MFNRQETLNRIKQMPDLVGDIREEIAQIQDVAYALPTFYHILQRGGYILSPKQHNLYEESLPQVKADRDGALYAEDPNTHEDISEALARKHYIDEREVQDISVHPTSVTFALSQDAFQDVYDPTQIGRSSKLPLGFTSYSHRFDVNGHTIRYSFRDSETSTNKTAVHEDMHVMYGYFHPDATNALPDQKYYKDSAANSYAAKDIYSFANRAVNITHAQMYHFLNELSARALERGSNTLDFTQKYIKSLYRAGYDSRMKGLSEGLPDDPKEKMEWEWLLWSLDNRLNHWIRFVDQEYRELLRAKVPTEKIINILMSQKPNHAYLMRFHNPRYAGAEDSEMLKWKKEYRQGWMPQTSEARIQDMVLFLASVSHMNIYEDFPEERYELEKQLRTKKKNLVWGAHSPSAKYRDPEFYSDIPFDRSNLEPWVKPVKESVSRKMQVIGTYEDFLNERDITDEEKKEVRSRLIKKIFDAHELFGTIAATYLFSFSDDLYDLQELNRSPRKKKKYFRELTADKLAFLKRNLEIDDAAAEMMEKAMAGKNIDLDRVFAPGFQRSNEQYERLLNLLVSEDEETTNGLSPFDDEVLTFFRMNFRHAMDTLNYQGRYVGLEEIPNRLFSTFTRILLWAKENNISDGRIAKIRKYFDELQSRDPMPDFQELLDAAI